MSHAFDVLFIGWSEAKGIWGDEFVQPVFRHIVDSRERQNEFVPEKLRISIRKMELQIMKQKFCNSSVKTFIEYQNFPLVDTSYCTKITYKQNAYVCLLVLGYDPYTGVPIHLNVYQTKNDDEATKFVGLILRKINKPALRKRLVDLENMLLEDNKIDKSQMRYTQILVPKSNCSSLSHSCSSECRSKQQKENPVQILKVDIFKESPPKQKSVENLQLPPRDYDTIHRKKKTSKSEENRYNPPISHLPFSKMN